MDKQHRIKWITNGVSFRRGNYETLIAKFDNSKTWLGLGAYCTTQTFKEEIRHLAQDFGAKVIELKPGFYKDDNGLYYRTEKDVINFLYSNKRASFAVDLPVPEGARRKIRQYAPEEIFI